MPRRMQQRDPETDAELENGTISVDDKEQVQDEFDETDASPMQAARNSMSAAMPSHDGLADDASAIATAVVIGVGAAIIESELIPGILIGAGALLLGKMFPQVGGVMRPVVKTVVRAGLAVTDKAREVVAEAGEQVQDVIAEVQAERAHGAGGGASSGAQPRRAAAPRSGMVAATAE